MQRVYCTEHEGLKCPFVGTNNVCDICPYHIRKHTKTIVPESNKVLKPPRTDKKKKPKETKDTDDTLIL